MNVRACDHCGAIEDLKATPPNVEPLQIRDAVANYDSIICETCKLTKSLREIMDKSVTTPGGTVDGPDKVPYLVHG
jgi:hypothetical protein